MRETQSERITDTLTWFPKHVPLPTATSTEIVTAGLQDVVNELKSPTNPNSLIDMTDNHRQELINITNMLVNIVQDDKAPGTQEAPPSPRVVNETITNAANNNGSDTPSPRVVMNQQTNNNDDNDTSYEDTPDKRLEINNTRKKQVTFSEELPTLNTYEYVTTSPSTTKRKSVKDVPIEKYPKIPQYEKYSHKRVTRASSNHA